MSTPQDIDTARTDLSPEELLTVSQLYLALGRETRHLTHQTSAWQAAQAAQAHAQVAELMLKLEASK